MPIEAHRDILRAGKSAFGAQEYTSAMIISLTSSSTGSTFVSWGSQACTALDIVNTAPTAVDLEVRRGGSGATIIIPAGTARIFVGLSNASDLQVRRQDMGNGTVTVTAESLS